MEIRIGIKFLGNNKNKTSTIISIDSNNIITYKLENGKMEHKVSISDFINNLKTNKFKLLEYPYKVGDWVYFTGENKGIKTEYWKVGLIDKILGFKDKDPQFKSSSNDVTGFRPCFIDEIPDYKEPIKVIEDYTYLIDILNKLKIE